MKKKLRKRKTMDEKNPKEIIFTEIKKKLNDDYFKKIR